MTVYSLFTYIGIAAIILTALRFVIKKPSDILLAYIQNFLGALFIFSGVVKAIDPLGTSYKMKEYFEAFAKDGMPHFWESIAHYSLEMSVFMIVLEIVLGIAIIIGWKEKIAVTLLFWMNLFFLFLTGYTYLSGYDLTKTFLIFTAILFFFLGASPLFDSVGRRRSFILSCFALVVLIFVICKFSDVCFMCEFTKTKMKVTDCGCFGDFIKLKPWETFYKDVFLTIITIYVVYFRNKIQPLFGENIRWAGVIAMTLISLVFCLKNFVWGLPVVDFRPYAIGNNINDQMKVILADSVELLFVYKNKTTGEEKKFKTSEIPSDTNWAYKDRIDNVIREGIPAKISNLMIEGEDGANITTSMINDSAKTYWIVAWDLKNTEKTVWKSNLKTFIADAKAKGIKVYALTNMHDQKFEQEMNLGIPFYLADATPLKTMIRSNPGLMEINNGKVKNLWHWRAIPEKVE
jgi:uncharacterized membrane protein YphA (DoxX/SURF4 family)